MTAVRRLLATPMRTLWRRLAAAVITDDPHQDLSVLDRLDGRH